MSRPGLSGALARAATSVTGSRFAKPAARVVLLAAGLLVLAAIGRSATAGGGPSASATAASASLDPSPDRASAGAPVASATPSAPSAEARPPPRADGDTTSAARANRAHAPASPDDPVVLNTATPDDLRRLPGVGAKRAEAILALRGRLGRFRAVEDLLKVKGIGRATLRRLRPLVRLEPATAVPSPVPSSFGRPDAGGPPVTTG